MTKDPLQQYKQFLATHPFRYVTSSGMCWPYLVAGRGEQALVLLPGAPGRAEASFEYMRAFERHYTVISIGYPADLATVEECLHGVVRILDAEGFECAHVVGGSYSGLLAQRFVRRYPGRVDKLVLSDTGVPRPARARKYRRYVRLLRVLPMFVIRALWRVGAYLYLHEMAPQRRPFWEAYFAQLRKTITRRECISRLQVWIDFDSGSRFSPGDLDGWQGEMLILGAERDTTFSNWERQALRRLYPAARVCVFTGGGHAASLDRRDEYIEAICDFLAAEPTRQVAAS
ncbi:MAG TPA: alpha/beta hydrolase [Chloroflexia bacterium]|jgi:proline iminopeptidase/2-hydroxymuconate-semialdehyde hydrolase